MNRNTTRGTMTIWTMLAVAVAVAGIMLTGCSRPGGAGRTAAAVADRGRPPASAAFAGDGKCAADLDLSRADNGTSQCVRLGGQVSVELMRQDDMSYSQIGLTGSSLTLQPVPTPFGVFIYKATSRGSTVLTATANVCSSSDGTGPCPPVTPWSVTVTVK